MSLQEREFETNGSRPKTIIEGSTNPEIISGATQEYMNTLIELAYPSDLDQCAPLVPKNILDLKTYFSERVHYARLTVQEIIGQINDRTEVLRGPEYKSLIEKDRSLWLIDGEKSPQYGTIACVDKGIPYEAIVGVDGASGRTLGGDIKIHYSRIRNRFSTVRSALYKRLIHSGRSGRDSLVEPLIEHTGCGRRGQIVGNEHGTHDVPSMDFVFKHVTALSKNMSGDEKDNKRRLSQVRRVWNSYEKVGKGLKTPDQGLYAGIVYKKAQRQALYNTNKLNMISPIEIYDKHNGDLIVGVDNIDVLTDESVLDATGFTPEALEKLREDGKIFSFRTYQKSLEHTLAENETTHQRGSRTYSDLQHNWLTVQGELVDITAELWRLYEGDETTNPMVQEMVNDYLDKALHHLPEENKPTEIEKRRLIHHIFHAYAYAHLLDTLNIGNIPGHHLEIYLAAGDHDDGTRPDVALGQGDLSRPSANEIFTGYTVLQHSKGLEDKPIVVMLKMDTDRSGDNQVSTEESEIGIRDLSEVMKLWPYFLVGDIVPVVVIRGKQHGGVSRLGLSIALALNDMVDMLESEDEYKLPQFVPANTSTNTERGKQSEMVLVPAYDILQAGIEAKGDLRLFRDLSSRVADKYDNDAVQASFRESV